MKSFVFFVALCMAVTIALPRSLLSAESSDSKNTEKQEDSQSTTQAVKPGVQNTGPASSNAPAASTPSEEHLSPQEEVSKELLQKTFTYNPRLLNDPFVSFIKPPEPSPSQVPIIKEDEELAPELQRPLTPLQKMNIGEIEKGLRAIVWGDLGRKAIIQDAAGKGYIVNVGTPAGGPTGVIIQIFDDRLVIQQDVWDRKLKRMVPRNEVVKLRKGKEVEG